MAKRSKVVLAIHGFTGHPEEVRFLGEQVAVKLDADLVLPTVAGHATTAEDLASTTAEDWYVSIEHSYDELAKDYSEVYVIGNSFGANLALKLASHRKVESIACVSIPYLTFWQRTLMVLLVNIYSPINKFWTKPVKGPFATEQIPGYTQLCYEKIPINAYTELVKFMRVNNKPTELKKIKAPVLFISSDGDPIVSPTKIHNYLSHISSEHKQLIVWEEQYHLSVQGKRKQEMADLVYAWFTEFKPETSAAAHEKFAEVIQTHSLKS